MDQTLPSDPQRPAASSYRLRNGAAVARAAIPVVIPAALRSRCVEAIADGARLAALVALDGGAELLAVLAHDERGELELLRTAPGEAYPALTPEIPAAQAFERALFEDWGVRPLGHPWLKPLRRHIELEAPASAARAAEPHPFFTVEGPSIHEVAVGPVHAGIIEPGHFRFQCHGETVLSLEIQLGYQHRGAHELFLRSTPARRLAIAESIAGDTAIGHSLAYVSALEALAGIEVPLTAQVIRGIALELERLANHVGDFGALCNDVGYLPTASFCGRLRGEFLNLSLELTGNRFGRGLCTPGGVRFGLDGRQRQELLARLATTERHVRLAAELALGSSTVLSRFEQTGVVSRQIAEDLGLVGPVARASGCGRDVRRDHPHGVYRFRHVPVAHADDGDVLARALVRWIEIQRSCTFVREQLQELPEGPLAVDLPPLGRDQLTVALVEGWRGEIAHIALTDGEGRLRDYAIVDPSLHNWFGLAMALRGNQISDFPLCNKSFNLSYAGHDL